MNAAPRLLALAVVLPFVATAAPVPPLLTHTGRLLDSSDQPANGVFSITITINTYSGADPRAPNEELWRAQFQNVTLADGVYALVLGDEPGKALPAAVFEGAERWLGIS